MPEGIPHSALWLVIAVVLAIIEAFTLGIVTLWFSIGALFAMIGSLIGLSFVWQVIIFIISSGILLYYTRPIVVKYLKLKTEKTNADRLIGKKGVVTETIDNINGYGQVKISGLVWSARSSDNDNIPANEVVEVLDISGVKLIVKKVSV
ncbi:MAG: NfeD family protein [Clostridia bacterium]|nr:NfeD family protein [Clostridia bacterium]